MNQIPAIAFSAWSGVGKTTIIESLIRNLKARGIRVAVIKHDAHQFEIDKEGKDSWRFAQAGADMTIISSAEKTALIEQRSLSLENAIAMVHDVDLIILEGYNNEALPHIGICRRDSGKMFRLPVPDHIALISDYSATEIEEIEHISLNIPLLALEDIDGLAEFILKYINL